MTTTTGSKSKPGMSRRGFLASSAAAASSLRILGANDRIRLGIIGTGNRGKNLMKHVNLVGGVEWVGVCDAWDVRRAEAAEVAGQPVQQYSDYRRLLERKDIDGVIVATFDHLHAPHTIAACRAGKDVYVEKPMTSTPEQGKEVYRAVKKHGTVLQVGMQRRSTDHFAEAKRRIFDSGLIGEVNMVHTFWHGNPGYLVTVPPGMQEKPAGLDWKACLGWLPERPWDPQRYFNRFAYWDFGTGGQTGGLMVHLVDVVHWFLNMERPRSAVALGGIYRFDDGRDTPDNINVVLEYPQKVTVTFDASLTDQIPYDPVDPITFRGSGGRFVISRRGYRFVPARSRTHLSTIEVGGDLDQNLKGHLQNWLERMRDRGRPNADVVAGHYSTMACLLANQAYQEKSRAEWSAEWEL